MDEQEAIDEYTRKNGEVMTIARYRNGYDVDQWDANGNNRWHKYFNVEADALAEYNRWRD